MKISVITVCYNSAQTIEDTILSVWKQDYGDKEHIIVDGMSKDGTLDVINKHRDKINCLVSEPDRGIYDAMNKGIAMAKGDVIGFLNADDVFLNDHVLAHIGARMQGRNLDAVLGDVVYVRPDNPDKIVRRYDSSRFSPKRIAWGWMPAHPSMYLRRQLYADIGPFRTDYRIAGDFEFVARAFAKRHLRYEHIPEVLVKMRIGGISSGGWRNTILLNREVLRACRENNIPTNIIKILLKYPAKILEFLRP